jgi:hypothetical protein
MHEQEGPCTPGEDEQDPAGNHFAQGLNQRGYPTEDFEDGGDPQRRNHPWNVSPSCTIIGEMVSLPAVPSRAQ